MEGESSENFEYQSVQTLKGVGQAVAEKLKRLEIYNVQDVLFHLPMRYWLTCTKGLIYEIM